MALNQNAITPKCSNSTLMPSRISTTPPAICAGFCQREPNARPMCRPAAENSPVTTPMLRMANAHGERIDAAGHGQGKHMLPIELGGLLGVFLIFFEGFVNHVAADEHQQGEDDPMVELGYVFAECRCREIAENREQHLESAEPEGAFHGVLYSYAGYGQAFANGYGECIHSYGNRNKQDLNDYRNHGVTEGSSPDYRAMGLDQRSYTPPTPS